jgi:hypothetical protein
VPENVLGPVVLIMVAVGALFQGAAAAFGSGFCDGRMTIVTRLSLIYLAASGLV